MSSFPALKDKGRASEDFLKSRKTSINKIFSVCLAVVVLVLVVEGIFWLYLKRKPIGEGRNTGGSAPHVKEVGPVEKKDEVVAEPPIYKIVDNGAKSIQIMGVVVEAVGDGFLEIGSQKSDSVVKVKMGEKNKYFLLDEKGMVSPISYDYALENIEKGDRVAANYAHLTESGFYVSRGAFFIDKKGDVVSN